MYHLSVLYSQMFQYLEASSEFIEIVCEHELITLYYRQLNNYCFLLALKDILRVIVSIRRDKREIPYPWNSSLFSYSWNFFKNTIEIFFGQTHQNIVNAIEKSIQIQLFLLSNFTNSNSFCWTFWSIWIVETVVPGMLAISCKLDQAVAFSIKWIVWIIATVIQFSSYIDNISTTFNLFILIHRIG